MAARSNILVSVLVCSHNPKPAALTRTLEALRAQTLSLDTWELLVIDSACDEPLAQRFDLTWHPHAQHSREDQVGKTRAFVHGVGLSAAPVLLIVDDDNVLAPDYLQQTVAIAASRPELGAWGGNVVLRFEEPPPEWTRPYWAFLAERAVTQDALACNLELSPPLPVGAGCSVRTAVARRYAEQLVNSPLRQSLGRTGKDLMAGEDSDLILTACEMGLSRGLFKSLRLEHLIPPERLTESYLLRLVEGTQFSSYVLEMCRDSRKAPPAINWWWRLKVYCDCLIKFGRKRRFYLANKRAQRRARAVYEHLEATASPALARS